MSRGRKPNSKLNNSTLEQVFNKSQGFYFQFIVTRLGKINRTLTDDKALNLLEKINPKKRAIIQWKVSKTRQDSRR